MPTKGKGIDSTFDTSIAKKPSLSERYLREMKGVEPTLNKPADEGKIHMRTFCDDYASLETSQVERMDTTLQDGVLDVRYNPGGDTRPKASENLDSTFDTKIK